MFLFFLYLCDVKGIYREVPFYHVIVSSTGFCVVSWVFGWASLYDASYRCVVGKGRRYVGVRIVDWDGIGGCSGGWSVELGALFYNDVHGLYCCERGVLGQPCTFYRCFQSRWLCLGVLWIKGVVVVRELVEGYQ